MKILENKVALITGASRGIGVSLAETLAACGASVVVNYARSEAEAFAVVEKIESAGGKAAVVKASVNDPDDVRRMFAQIKDIFGGVDILVNNAGITKDNLLVRMSDADFDAVIDINLKGAIYCTREAVPYMLSKGYGKIINISSIVGFSGNPGQINYVGSKGGLASLTRSSAKEFGAGGIRVNAVAPGFIQTEMTDVLPADVKTAMLENIILQSLGTVEDIASAVRYLSLPESDYITGQVIHVNGGLYL